MMDSGGFARHSDSDPEVVDAAGHEFEMQSGVWLFSASQRRRDVLSMQERGHILIFPFATRDESARVCLFGFS